MRDGIAEMRGRFQRRTPECPGVVPSTGSSATTAVLFAIFVPTGIVNTMLGPMLPLLSMQWSLSDAQAGYLFSAQFVGSIFGVAMSGGLVSWGGFRTVILAGLVMMAGGVGSLPVVPATLGLATVFVFGVGLGLIIPTANLLVATINPGSSAAALNYLNLFWGLGAVTCPFLVAACQRHFRTILPVEFGVAALLSLCALSLALLKISPKTAVEHPPSVSGTMPSIRNKPILPVLAGLFFLYVATESGVAGWIASHAKRTGIGHGTLWAIVPAFFWGALLLGRAIGHLLLRVVSELAAIRIHLLVAIAGIITLIAIPKLAAILCGSVAAGLGLSTVFPAFINILSEKFGANAARAGSLLFALAGLGGALGPLTVGFVSEHFSLKAGFFVPLAGCVAMLALCRPRGKWRRQAPKSLCFETLM